MNKLYAFVIIILFITGINAQNLHFNLYPKPEADTLYVLPGEFFYSAGGFSVNSGNAITGFRFSVQVTPNLATNSNSSFRFQTLTGDLGALGYITLDTNDNVEKVIAWTANSINGIQGLGYDWIFGNANLPLGEFAKVIFHAEAVIYNQLLQEPVILNGHCSRAFQSIDGILGDFDGDGYVTENDVNELQRIYTESNGFGDLYRYNKTGPNVGRASILFDDVTLADMFILRLWINDHQNPLVKDLGIGQLMSNRIRPVQVPFQSSVSGNNTISINTRADVVRISSGTWSSSEFVKNGQAVFTIPDRNLHYKIEAVKLMASIDSKTSLPTEFKLDQNYPNPFNPSTTISYSIPTSGFVTLKVYDVLGKEVATLVNEEKMPGNYRVNFSGSNLASGTYICRLSTGKFSQTTKMILMK